MADSGRDFFISYTAVNRPWAEWIAVQLEAAGYTTVLQAWDFRPGSDFLHEMQQATTLAGRTIAVLSPAYLGSAFGEAEWRAAFHKDPSGELGLLVWVQECAPPGLLASRVYIDDLVDTDEATARQRLLTGIDQSGARPTLLEAGDDDVVDSHRGYSTGGDGKVDTTWALVWHLDAAGKVDRVVNLSGDQHQMDAFIWANFPLKPLPERLVG